MGAVVSAAWLLAWTGRLRFQGPNVDDYLYTLAACAIADPLSHGDILGAAWAALHTGHDAPLVPILAAPLCRFGPDGEVLVQLPLMVALGTLIFMMVRARLGSRWAAVVAALSCLTPQTLGWSMMVHTALAATMLSLAALHFAVGSDGFSHRRPSLLVGLCGGLLLLSRTLAPVYVAALVTALAVATVRYHQPNLATRQRRNALLAIVTMLLVAAPWWLVNGRTTAHYLLSAGYTSAGGFTAAGASPISRAVVTAREYGYGGTLLLVVTAGLAFRRREGSHRLCGANSVRGLPAHVVALLGLFTTLVIIGLATSANPGTAFALPATMAATVGVGIAAHDRRRARWPYLVGGTVIASLSTLTMTMGSGNIGELNRWVPGAPYADQAIRASGDAVTSSARSAALQARLVDMMGSGSVEVMRDDALVNVNGLLHEKQRRRLRGAVTTPPYDPSALITFISGQPKFAITGSSCEPYHRNVNESAIHAALTNSSYRLIWVRRISYCNVVELWAASSGHRREAAAATRLTESARAVAGSASASTENPYG